MAELRTLVTGLVVGESPRWHDGRLWYANWGAQEIRTVDDSGSGEVIAMAPKPVGYCIDWLPDGALIVTGEDPVWNEPNGWPRQMKPVFASDFVAAYTCR